MNLNTRPMPRENNEDENRENKEFMQFYKKEVIDAPANAEVMSKSITPFLALYESIESCKNTEDAEKVVKDYEEALNTAKTGGNGQLLRFLETHKINIRNIAEKYNIKIPSLFSIILEKKSKE